MPRDPPSCGSRLLSCQPFQAQTRYQNSTGVFQTTSTSTGTSRLKVDSECPWGSFCPVYMNYHWGPNANLIPTPTSCPLGLASVLMASALHKEKKYIILSHQSPCQSKDTGHREGVFSTLKNEPRPHCGAAYAPQKACSPFSTVLLLCLKSSYCLKLYYVS